MAGYRSFLFPEAELGSGYAVLDARESHHLVRVFRAPVGAEVELLDGQGRCYAARIVEADAKRARLAIESIKEHKRQRPEVTLVQAVPKGKAMDLILRMASELGAAAIQPIFTAQGEVQLSGDRLATKLGKWRLTMVEACKQCGLPWMPELKAPLSFETWLEQDKGSPAALRLVAGLVGVSRPLLEVIETQPEAPQTVRIAVGPEGDFSVAEYADLSAADWQAVQLGTNVLRAETAAAYVLSVLDQAKRT
ncbi:MAG: RsmE family RNA methyltransferase [Verrucomicrobia bacterium]|nr:RsmE family RNA methyltransferase [Verrucomicrobiota bacterium]